MHMCGVFACAHMGVHALGVCMHCICALYVHIVCAHCVCALYVCVCVHMCAYVCAHTCKHECECMYMFTCMCIYVRCWRSFLEEVEELGGAPQNNKNTEFVSTGDRRPTDKPILGWAFL